MRIIVSGPTGAIGMALLQLCQEQDMEILAICRKDSSRRVRLEQYKNVNVLNLDLCDYAGFQPEKQQYSYDVFFHFAWEATSGNDRDNVTLQHKNIAYALDAVKLAKRFGCHTFVGAGSQAEFGRVEGKLTSDTPAFPESGYGMAKLCAGQMTRLLCEQIDMRHIWTRILSVYGPYDGEQTLVLGMIRKLLNGQTVDCTKGEQRWDYLYSKDAAKAMLLLAQKGKSGKVYCIGSGKSHPLQEYIRIIKEVVNPDGEIRFGALEYGPRQVMHLCADISELTNDTGFIPETDFTTGIRHTLEYVKRGKCNELI